MRRRNHQTEKGKSKNPLQFRQMQIVILMFFLLVLVLYFVQKSVFYHSKASILGLLDTEEAFSEQAELVQKPECLYIWEDDAQGSQAREMMESTLSQMKVPYQAVRVEDAAVEMFQDCRTVVVGVTDLSKMGDTALDLIEWLKAGGNLLFLYLPSNSGYLATIQDSLGITAIDGSAFVLEGIHFTRPYMPGGTSRDFYITDPYASSWRVLLKKECQVYAESTDDMRTPLFWRYPVGKGVAVVGNIGMVDKSYRGFYCAAYSLLGDGAAYPVINGSAFYIDEFPSPVPGGEDKFISRDYGLDVKDFLSQVWWPDIQDLGRKYNIRYTGALVEQLTDQVKGPFERNNNMSRYQYFGNQLLDMGGEIGYGGYNPMPLVMENFDYRGRFDAFQRWQSYDDMKAGFSELTQFCGFLFPGEQIQVYVPSANILSDEGRQMLAADFPQIRAIAASYFPGSVTYEQEFEVASDGIVDTPRIVSGYALNDFTWLTELGELTFHFVNTHFQSPDDALDENQGAELGWAEMYRGLDRYAEWLYGAAPQLRNLTGSELAAAVQRYDALQVKTVYEENAMVLELGNFVDEAWLLVRLNGHRPGTVTGGTLEELLDGLYLLKAEQADIEISYQSE